MKSMSDSAGLTGRHTNHSVRMTMISTLRKENVIALVAKETRSLKLFKHVYRTVEGHVPETQQLHLVK